MRKDVNMLTNELIERYLDDLKETKSQETAIQVKRILAHVKEYEDYSGKDLINFTLDDFKDMFAKNKWAIAYSGFYRNKSIIIAFIRWLRKDTDEHYSYVLDDLSPTMLDSSNSWEDYFASEAEFLEAVESVLGEDQLIREQTISVLYWVGLSRKEVIELKKQDLDKENLTILGKYKVSEKIFSIVSKCEKTSFYEVLGNDRWSYTVCFGASDYVLKMGSPVSSKGTSLVRSGEDAKITIDVTNKLFKNINKKFSELSPLNKFYDKRLKNVNLKNNGLFTKLKAIEESNGVLFENPQLASIDAFKDTLELYGAKSPNAILYKWRMYCDWKEYFGL